MNNFKSLPSKNIVSIAPNIFLGSLAIMLYSISNINWVEVKPKHFITASDVMFE